MIIKLFGKQIAINNKKWKQDLAAWSLLHRTEIVIAVASFILGAIIFQMNKQLTQKQNLKQLMRLTLMNILNAKGVIYTYYKQQERLNETRQRHSKE